MCPKISVVLRLGTSGACILNRDNFASQGAKISFWEMKTLLFL
jgi:hypothetical protein